MSAHGHDCVIRPKKATLANWIKAAPPDLREYSPINATNFVEIAMGKKEMPTRIEDLIPLSFVGETAVSFFGKKLRLIKNLGKIYEQLDATYHDALQAAKCLLLVYQRLGDEVDRHTASAVESGRAGGKGIPSEKTEFMSISKLAKDHHIDRKRLEDAKKISLNPQYIDTVVSSMPRSDRRSRRKTSCWRS